MISSRIVGTFLLLCVALEHVCAAPILKAENISEAPVIEEISRTAKASDHENAQIDGISASNSENWMGQSTEANFGSQSFPRNDLGSESRIPTVSRPDSRLLKEDSSPLPVSSSGGHPHGSGSDRPGIGSEVGVEPKGNKDSKESKEFVSEKKWYQKLWKWIMRHIQRAWRRLKKVGSVFQRNSTRSVEKDKASSVTASKDVQLQSSSVAENPQFPTHSPTVVGNKENTDTFPKLESNPDSIHDHRTKGGRILEGGHGDKESIFVINPDSMLQGGEHIQPPAEWEDNRNTVDLGNTPLSQLGNDSGERLDQELAGGVHGRGKTRQKTNRGVTFLIEEHESGENNQPQAGKENGWEDYGFERTPASQLEFNSKVIHHHETDDKSHKGKKEEERNSAPPHPTQEPGYGENKQPQAELEDKRKSVVLEQNPWAQLENNPEIIHDHDAPGKSHEGGKNKEKNRNSSHPSEEVEGGERNKPLTGEKHEGKSSEVAVSHAGEGLGGSEPNKFKEGKPLDQEKAGE